MNRDEIDVLWHRALSEAVDAGEIYTRYRFAAFVAAAEREACAQVCENIEEHDETISDTYYSEHYAAAIRARGQA